MASGKPGGVWWRLDGMLVCPLWRACCAMRRLVPHLGVGGADHGASDGDDATALPHHGDHWAGAHVVNQAAAARHMGSTAWLVQPYKQCTGA